MNFPKFVRFFKLRRHLPAFCRNFTEIRGLHRIIKFSWNFEEFWEFRVILYEIFLKSHQEFIISSIFWGEWIRVHLHLRIVQASKQRVYVSRVMPEINVQAREPLDDLAAKDLLEVRPAPGPRDQLQQRLVYGLHLCCGELCSSPIHQTAGFCRSRFYCVWISLVADQNRTNFNFKQLVLGRIKAKASNLHWKLKF